MGKFSDRAREIKARGEEERGNWQPTEGSVPLRMYRYWASVTPSRVPERENFCHYWRVVAIWAPANWVFNKVYDFVTSAVGIGVMIAAYMMLAYFSWKIFGLPGLGAGMLLAPWAVLGVTAGVYVGVERERNPILLMATAITFPISLPIIGLAAVYRWWPQWMTKIVLGLLVGISVCLGLFLIYELVTNVPATDLLLALGGMAVVVAAVVGIIYSATYIAGRRAIKRDEERQVRLMAILNGTAQPLAPAVREPGRISKFFSGVGDIIIFAAQVVRVKKWKICPIVQIPDDEALV